MAFIEVNEMNFNETLKTEFSKNQIVILKFGSPYCDACMALGFELQELDNELANVTILEIDCVESQEIAASYAIAQVPTMIIYENENSILWQKEGVMLADDIKKIIQS
jgi:thioredoxin 1